jgi:hypothetical protein
MQAEKLSDSEWTKAVFVAGIIVGLILGVCFTSLAWHHDIADHRREAIKRNAADWVTDIDGNTGFKWKPVSECLFPETK